MYITIIKKVLSLVTTQSGKAFFIPDTKLEAYHPIDLGRFEKDGESFPLAGSIYCPFEYNFKVDESNIAGATQSYIDWAIQVGLIPDKEAAKEKLARGDFARFASLTTVSFDLKSFDPKKMEGLTTIEKIKYIQENHTIPLSLESASRKSKYLTFLFLHDDWAERQKKPQLVKRVSELIYKTMESPQEFTLLKAEFYELLGRKEGENLSDEKDYTLVLGLIKAASDLRKIYSQGFYELTLGKSGVVGYQDFLASVKQYLEGTDEETLNREAKQECLTEAIFNQKRLYTCAVYTVYVAAVLESGVQIPTTILPNTSEDQLRINFSRLICRFNGLISAPREKDKPNWVNNDLNFIKLSREGEGKAVSLEDALVILLRNINAESKDSEQILEKMVAELPYLLYTCIIMQWGIGSIPAQLCSERYSEHRAEGPYIPKDKKPEIGSDFWRFVTPN